VKERTATPKSALESISDEEELSEIEKQGPLGPIKAIQEEPVPKGVEKKTIFGETMDFHDLEDFIVSISPYKFVTLMKLKNQMLREQLLKYARKKPAFGGGMLKWIILIVLLILGAMAFIFLLPMITQMLSGAAEGAAGGM
jgi:hypothetical protein